jgi:hypothetical protein
MVVSLPWLISRRACCVSSVTLLDATWAACWKCLAFEDIVPRVLWVLVQCTTSRRTNGVRSVGETDCRVVTLGLAWAVWVVFVGSCVCLNRVRNLNYEVDLHRAVRATAETFCRLGCRTVLLNAPGKSASMVIVLLAIARTFGIR